MQKYVKLDELIAELQWLYDRGYAQKFSVGVVKLDGTYRLMNCQFFVEKHLAGGPPAYDFFEKKQLPVLDVNAVGKHGDKDKGYRTFKWERLLEAHIDGVHWIVKNPKVEDPRKNA